ncbi:MAG: hypothetical protein KC535_01495 [Nanoarchaeota archaeon]|nr:hypothetical protein [Nanoarchaeota archaeon]
MVSTTLAIGVYLLVTVVIIPSVASLVTFRAVFGVYPKRGRNTREMLQQYAVKKFPKKKETINNIFDFHYNKFASHYAIFDVVYELQEEFPKDEFFRKVGNAARTMLILAVIYALVILFPLLDLMGL